MKTTTFYSYKGGLGRSLVLAWSARALADGGSKTVAIDFDLEAPGLAFKLGFSPKDDLGPGLIGLLTRFQAGDAPPESLSSWLRPVPGHERLWLLPAGPLASKEYWRQLAAISWEQLFFAPEPQGARFVHWLREAIEREVDPEHLLVDARTGVTEMGGAALVLLADQILALVGMSPEGLHGTREVLRSVVSSPRQPGRTAPRLGVILSRVAYAGADRIQRMRRTVREYLREEAEPLTSTVAIELPLVVRTESVLQEDEALALSDEELRVHEDYRAVLDWLKGAAVREDAPGLAVSTNASADDLVRTIQIQRELAERRPDEYLPDLASALDDLGRDLASGGRHTEALETAREAVSIRRRLAAEDRDRYLPELALSLNNLGAAFSELGHREDALDATQEAVAIRRELAQARPDAFQSELAMSLSNLGIRLSELGRREDALHATSEAVELTLLLSHRLPTSVIAPQLLRRTRNLVQRAAEAKVDPQTIDAVRRSNAWLAEHGVDAAAPGGSDSES